MEQRRNQWIGTLRRLVSEVRRWAEKEGWKVQEMEETITEEPLGTYQAPALLVQLPAGRLQLRPIALHVIGAEGRVDLEGFPTLNRVRLLRHNKAWTIMTDSNVPIHVAWNEKTFAQLALDLLA